MSCTTPACFSTFFDLLWSLLASKQWHQLYQLLSEKKTLHCQLCSACYTAVWNNNCLQRASAIKIVTMKITLRYEWKPSHAYHKIDTFRSEQRWMGYKTGNFMKNALYVQWYGKGTSWAEATSKSKKIKPVALSYASLKGIKLAGRQTDRQLVSQ